MKFTIDDQTVQIDYEAWKVVKLYKWRLNPSGYPITHVPGGKGAVTMHKLLFGAPPNGYEYDHINGDKLDNRTVNLRLCNHLQNCQNRSKNSRNTSGSTGVSWVASRKKWLAQLCFNGIRRNLGRFNTKEEAEAAYKTAKESAINRAWNDK